MRIRAAKVKMRDGNVVKLHYREQCRYIPRMHDVETVTTTKGIHIARALGKNPTGWFEIAENSEACVTHLVNTHLNNLITS